MVEIEIYDTTLRDGTQGEGIALSVADKLRIAERLDAFGVHYVEGGWPGSNPKDIEFFQQAKHRTFRRARLAAFGSTRRKDVRAEADDQVRLLLDASTPVVTIYGKTWLLHVLEVLQTTPAENLAMIEDTVRHLKAHGKFVVYDAEHAFDGCKDDRAYALATWQAAERGGADLVVLCDTNGGSLPAEIHEMTEYARGGLGLRLGIHTHDDIGLGVANALASIDAGATHVQGTLNGYGERTGNCNLTSVMPILHFKYGRPSIPPDSLPQLKELSQFLDETANVRPNPRLPWVGAAAFSHKGGTHVNAVQKLIRSYEHIDPAFIGNTRHVLISDLAGRSNIVMKARELGFDLTNTTPELRDMLARIKELEHQGYEFETADGSLALLIRRALIAAPPPFLVDAYHVSMRRDADRLSLRGRRQGPGRRRIGAPRGRGRWTGECPRRRAASGVDPALPPVEGRASDRLQSAHHRFHERHRRPNARAHRIERRRGRMGHRRRQRQHRGSQPSGARRQSRIRLGEGSENLKAQGSRLKVARS